MSQLNAEKFCELIGELLNDLRCGASAPEESNIHLPYLVCLLKSAGFQLGSVQYSSPQEISSFPDRSRGISVVITCSHSGQKCVMRLPEKEEQCNCLKVDSEKDSWIEAFSKEGNVKTFLVKTPTGSVPCLPVISDEMQSLSKSALNVLTRNMKADFIREHKKCSETVTTISTSTLSGKNKSFLDAITAIANGNSGDSSSDGLKHKVNEPGMLKVKIPQKTKSSSDLNSSGALDSRSKMAFLRLKKLLERYLDDPEEKKSKPGTLKVTAIPKAKSSSDLGLLRSKSDPKPVKMQSLQSKAKSSSELDSPKYASLPKTPQGNNVKVITSGTKPNLNITITKSTSAASATRKSSVNMQSLQVKAKSSSELKSPKHASLPKTPQGSNAKVIASGTKPDLNITITKPTSAASATKESSVKMQSLQSKAKSSSELMSPKQASLVKTIPPIEVKSQTKITKSDSKTKSEDKNGIPTKKLTAEQLKVSSTKKEASKPKTNITRNRSLPDVTKIKQNAYSCSSVTKKIVSTGSTKLLKVTTVALKSLSTSSAKSVTKISSTVTLPGEKKAPTLKPQLTTSRSSSSKPKSPVPEKTKTSTNTATSKGAQTDGSKLTVSTTEKQSTEKTKTSSSTSKLPKPKTSL